MRDRSARAGTGERLREARRLAVIEVGEAVEDVRNEEVTGEVVEDVVLIDVEAALERVVRHHVRRGVRELFAADRRLARAERVAADVENARAFFKDLRFWISAVGQAGLGVFRPLSAYFVEERAREHVRVIERERVGVHERVARVLYRVSGVAVLEVDAGELLAVVAQREVIARRELRVGLEEID